MSAVARIRVEVEVTVGSWSEEATFSTLKDQVKREGIQIIRNALLGKGSVVGEPKCLFVVVNERE